MAQNPDFANSAHELVRLCQKLDASGGNRFDAVVLLRDNTLHCFEVRGANIFEPMTIQISYSEELARYAASEQTLINRCLPDVVSKIGPSNAPRIAFIDADLLWSHETLLRGWVQRNVGRREYSRLKSITVETYLSLPDEPLELDSSVVLKPVSHGEKTHVLTSDLARTKIKARGLVRATKLTSVPTVETEEISLESLEDVPAEFDQIVWKVVAQTRLKSGGTKTWHELASDGKCFSTIEMAQRSQEAVYWIKAVKMFRQLRREEGSSVEVPMVGFTSADLHAAGHLRRWSLADETKLSDDEFNGLRTKRYMPFEIKGLVLDPIVLSAYRCLRSSAQGLLLFDLTEDIICDLTGVTKIRLSLSDVLRVYEHLNVGRMWNSETDCQFANQDRSIV